MATANDDRKTIFFDMTARKPLCVLLQAALGGDVYFFRNLLFPSDLWVLHTQGDVKAVHLTEKEWYESRDKICTMHGFAVPKRRSA